MVANMSSEIQSIGQLWLGTGWFCTWGTSELIISAVAEIAQKYFSVVKLKLLVSSGEELKEEKTLHIAKADNSQII